MPEDAPQREHNTEQLLADRRRKLQRLRDEFGVDPYGQRVDGLIPLAQAQARYDPAADQANKDDPETDDRPVVRVAGRVMAHRVMGNLIFMSLRDATGDLQLAVSKKLVGQPAFSIAKMTDLSDVVVAEGPLAKTNKGQISVWAVSQESGDGSQASGSGASAPAPPSPLPGGFQIACKSLALPPGKFHGLTDAETRYRKRYVDLYTNPEVMQTMLTRSRILKATRDFFTDRGFVEVETPMMQPQAGAPRPDRSSPTTTRWTSTCSCASRPSCTSSACWSAGCPRSSRSTATSATRASTARTTPSSPCSSCTRRSATSAA